MIKKIIFSFLFFQIFFNSNQLFSQARPSLQINVGLTIPGSEFGGDLVTEKDSGIVYINTDFVKNNYGTSTGVIIGGTIKFPLQDKGILSLLIGGSYSYFNTFRRTVLGTTIENNITVPVRFDNRFSSTTAALGLEATPFQNSKITPFINTNLTMNILSLALQRNDIVTSLFNDAFRLGLLTNAGMYMKISKEYSIVLSAGYHLSNLLLKSQSGSYDSRIDFDRGSLPINDEEGEFYTNLSEPDSAPVFVEGKTKNISSWNINLGIVIMLGK